MIYLGIVIGILILPIIWLLVALISALMEKWDWYVRDKYNFLNIEKKFRKAFIEHMTKPLVTSCGLTELDVENLFNTIIKSVHEDENTNSQEDTTISPLV